MLENAVLCLENVPGREKAMLRCDAWAISWTRQMLASAPLGSWMFAVKAVVELFAAESPVVLLCPLCLLSHCAAAWCECDGRSGRRSAVHRRIHRSKIQAVRRCRRTRNNSDVQVESIGATDRSSSPPRSARLCLDGSRW